MEGDRHAALVRRLAASQKFDFAHFDSSKAQDQIALQRALLREETQAYEVPIIARFLLQLTYLVAVSARPGTSAETIESRAKSAHDAYHTLQQFYLPWRATEKEDAPSGKVAEYDALYDTWKSYFGDPDDPAVQENIRKTAEYLARTAAEGVQKHGMRGMMS